MAHRESDDIFPGDMAILSELGDRLDDYQDGLATGSLAGVARTQARDAFLVARPVLERLHDDGSRASQRFLTLFDAPRAGSGHHALAVHLQLLRQELRALIANLSSRGRHGDGAQPSASRNAQQAGAVHAAGVSSSGRIEPAMFAAPQVSVWILVSMGIAVGLVLGIFGTRLPRSGGALVHLWVVLQPVVAAAAAGIIGGLLVQDGFEETVRKKWPALLVSSLLLIGTAPTAVDAGRELLGMAGGIPPVAATAVADPGVEPGDGRPSGDPVVRREPAAALTAMPPASPGTVRATRDASGTPAAATSASTPAPAAGPASQETRRATLPPSRRSARCLQILERQQVGDELTAAEQSFLQRECGAL